MCRIQDEDREPECEDDTEGAQAERKFPPQLYSSRINVFAQTFSFFGDLLNHRFGATMTGTGWNL